MEQTCINLVPIVKVGGIIWQIAIFKTIVPFEFIVIQKHSEGENKLQKEQKPGANPAPEH